MNQSSLSTQILRVVSVSLGSAARDHTARAHLLGRDFLIERRGTDGDIEKAKKLIGELDGKVAAIGLGGIDLYVVSGSHKYTLREAIPLARAAKTTPVVDGSGLKDTLEREAVHRLQREGAMDFRGKNVLLVSAVDRFGMAEALVQSGAKVEFGDLMFLLNIPLGLRNLHTFHRAASLILPLAVQLPLKWIYPTGDKQKEIVSTQQHEKFYERAQIIAGDFLLIRRFLPEKLDGKTILTNTVTRDDIELLKARGAAKLITTTPELEGRSFGTNVMEGVFAALGATTPREYSELLKQLNWSPRVVNF